MDQILDLLQTSSLSSQSDLNHVLSACAEQKVFMRKSSKVESIVTQINYLLSSNDNHGKGVLLLHSFLPQCNSSTFADHGFFWMQQCLKSVDQDDAVTALELFTLCDLFKLSADYIDLRKNVVNTLLPKFFDKVGGKGTNEVRAAKTKCLSVVMQFYAGACGLRRGIIDKFIQKSLKQMSLDDEEWLHDTCKCYLLLAQCGGSGGQGFIHKGNWGQQSQILINSAHYLLDSLFDSITEIQVSKAQPDDVTDKKLGVLESIPAFDNAVTRYNTLSSLFCKTMKLLQTMLLGSFPAAKSVMPISIFGVLCRGLAVNCLTISTKSLTLDKIALMSVIPFIHVELFNTLTALIKCCGRNLIPYASLICKLTCQSLKWTAEEWEYSQEKPCKSVKIATYQALQSWLNCARLSSCIEPFTNELLELLEKDFKYDKPSVKLLSKNQITDGKGKRKKQHYAQEDESERKDFTKLENLTSNKEICYEALISLELVLRSASTSIAVPQLTSFQTSIIKILLDINQSNNGIVPIPYSNVSCRLQLYRVLFSLVMEARSDGTTSTPYATVIFAQGLMNVSQQISSFCSEALSSIEKLIHPLSSSLYFPSETTENVSENGFREEISIARDSEENSRSTPGDISGPKKSSYMYSQTSKGSKNSTEVNTVPVSSSGNLNPLDSPKVPEASNVLSAESNFDTKESTLKTSYHKGTLPVSNRLSNVTSELSPSYNGSQLETIPEVDLETGSAAIRNNTKSNNIQTLGKSVADSLMSEISEVRLTEMESQKNSVVFSKKSTGDKKIVDSSSSSSAEPPFKKLRTSPQKSSQDAVVKQVDGEATVATVATDSNDDEVEEMLADFVDLVNDERVSDCL